MSRTTLATPIGPVTICADGYCLTQIILGSDRDTSDATTYPKAQRQLAEYFAGTRRNFDLAYRFSGTPFQEAVWREIATINYGETRTYGDIAKAIGRPRAARAVGQAAHVNPISIVIGCHRVVGSGHRLVGYGGGIDAKRWLLRLEGSLSPGIDDE